MTGRDIVEAEYALTAESGYLWRLDGGNLDLAADRADERRENAAKFKNLGKRDIEVIRFVEDRRRVTAPHVAAKFGIDPKRASDLLGNLAKRQLIEKIRHGEYGPAGCALDMDFTDLADMEGFADSRISRSPAESVKSVKSTTSVKSSKSVGALNTCECGAPLMHQTSINRGVCAECWGQQHSSESE